MSLFQLILVHFASTGCTKDDQVTHSHLTQLLDRISNANCGLSPFDRDIAQQLWEHTHKSSDGRVQLKDFIQTVIDARNILI
jgi:hypothetical protein